jgi:hypothetical protein
MNGLPKSAILSAVAAASSRLMESARFDSGVSKSVRTHPPASGCIPAHNARKNDETKPIHATRASSTLRDAGTVSFRGASDVEQAKPTVSSRRILTHPDASTGIRAHLQNAVGETKPTGMTQTESTELSPRQLAAARALAMGMRVHTVAAELPVHRTTLLRWRKLPAFTDELRRLHWEMTIGASRNRG